MSDVYKKLTEEIKKHNHIFIMAHKNIDLDALGSSICLYQIISSFKKDCYILLNKNETNTSIVKALNSLEKEHISISFVDREQCNQYVSDDSLLIVLDTHKRNMLEVPFLLDEIKDVIVLDHHVKSGDYIENTIFSYIRATLSSMNEFMVGYLKYLNKEIQPVIATIMLAGIQIDTNSFNVKTSASTYEAASKLAWLGADNIVKQELLQENKEIYMQRQSFIQNSFNVDNVFEVCVLDDNIYERKDLALISEELLKFEDVEASFTIGKTSKSKLGISARSLGRINVEVVMSKLGGGGHMTDAAAQILTTNIEEGKSLLLGAIKEAIDEGNIY